MNKFQILVAVSFLVLSSCSVYKLSPEITETDLRHHLRFLSSDALKGRYPGTPGDANAGRYIDEQFKRLQLPTQKQEFYFVQSLKRGSGNVLVVHDQEMPSSAYTPVSFSSDTLITAPVVFAGYGIQTEADSFKWNDYGGLNVKDKWVVVLRGVPDIPEWNTYLSIGSDDRDKAMLARDNGAAGIIFISGTSFDPEDKLMDISSRQASVGIPALQVTRPVADKLLSTESTSVQFLESAIRSKKGPENLSVTGMLKAGTDIEQVMGTTANWMAIVEGSDPQLKKEYLVVGAHHDHLGMGGSGSSSRRPDTLAVHNGADDNASGISALLEIAGKLMNNKTLLKRSVLLVAFGAEEMGLLGSKYFVNHPPVPLPQIDAMVNLDMLGRMDTLKGIQIGGTGTSAEADSLIRHSNRSGKFRINMSQEGSGPSDHSSFYGRNIPVFFITTGAHNDYHTPDDDAEKINYPGLQAVTEFACRLILAIDGEATRLTFKEAGPKESPAANYRFKVTLGFMPDFSATDVEGVRVDFVSKGKAAERGGIRNGDIITAIDGLKIRNIYDYMYRLSKLSRNQIISVEILRNERKEVLIIQL